MAPCGFPVKLKEARGHTMGVLGIESETFLGLYLVPTFSHYRGKLLMAEQALSKMLANQRLAFDRSFMVLLKERQDVRDSRPLNLVGKFLTPSTSDSTASDLCKKNIVGSKSSRRRGRPTQRVRLARA
jgi:hypothetical protein